MQRNPHRGAVGALKGALISAPLIYLLSACSAAPTMPPAGQTQPAGQSQPAAQSQPATSAGGGGLSFLDAAEQIKDACTVMPLDLARKLVPGGSAPQTEQFPPRCTVTNGTSVLEITIGAAYTGGAGYVAGSVAGAEDIPGLAAGAYLERPVLDDAYLTVLLDPDQGLLYVEVAGHDGKDHKDDAIAVAQAILAKLH